MKANPKVSDAVKRLLTIHGQNGKPMTIQAAEIRSGVSYSVISNLAAGRVPGADHIILFAAAFGEDVVDWLKLCGYDDIAKIIAEERAERPSGSLEALVETVPVEQRGIAMEAAKMAVEAVIYPFRAGVMA